MKNLFILVAVATFGTGAFAQDYKPSKGTVTTEVGLTGGLGNSNVGLTTNNAFGAPLLKFRYFFKDNIAFRLGFAIDRTATKATPTTTTEIVPAPIPAPPAVPTNTTTIIDNTTLFLMSIGAEKHFKGSDRLSTFVGADILLGSSKRYQETNSTTTTVAPVTTSNSVLITKNGSGGQSVFGLGLFTGADYYIAKKVYLGIELGLQILSTNEKDRIQSLETSGTGIPTTTTTTTIAPDANQFDFDSVMNGGIKIGYQF